MYIQEPKKLIIAKISMIILFVTLTLLVSSFFILLNKYIKTGGDAANINCTSIVESVSENSCSKKLIAMAMIFDLILMIIYSYMIDGVISYIDKYRKKYMISLVGTPRVISELIQVLDMLFVLIIPFLIIITIITFIINSPWHT